MTSFTGTWLELTDVTIADRLNLENTTALGNLIELSKTKGIDVVRSRR